jgi:hypothetical protein
MPVSQRRIRSEKGATIKSAHSDRLERWLGADTIERLSASMKGWYGPPIHILDCPGSVRICSDGDFIGPFEHGYGISMLDALRERIRRSWQEIGRSNPALMNAGFASIGDALSRASQGYTRQPAGAIAKSGPTKVVNSCSSLWRVGPMPAAGGAGGAAPGGTAHVDSDTGGMLFANPAAGTLHLTGADFSASVINNAVMIYDRLFSVAKTINSTGTESVTGVPTRYQSSTPTAADYAGGNFLFIEVGATQLANTAHNWTVCQYRDDAGNDAQTLPSVTGNPGGVATIVDRFDMPVNTWFCPLATGDVGIMDLHQMQCSALVATGACNFVIGHPLGVMSFPVINSLLPFDWLTNRNQAPRIFDDACIALFELPAPATTATTYNGIIYATNAAA